MIRLCAVVEGQTEEAFANRTIVPHLALQNVFGAIQLVENRRKATERRFKGGIDSFSQIERHLLRWWKQERSSSCWFTTMFDLYALPSDFPGYSEAMRLDDPYERVERLEKAFFERISEQGCRHFVPYIQLHEFEALILSDPQKLGLEFLEHDRAIDTLIRDVEHFSGPELIDQEPDSAPSKRIIKRIPEYEFRKASAGPVVASKIGLPALREKCPHFNQWLRALEALSHRSAE